MLQIVIENFSLLASIKRICDIEMLKKIIFITLCIILLVGYDFTTKKIAKYGLEQHTVKSYLGGTIQFVYQENTGGMLSLGSQLSETYKIILFRVLVPLVLTLIFVYTVMKKNLGKLQIASLILLLGGGLGNWLDRILNNGKVIDFIIVGFRNFHTGIFNMADFYVTVGVILLFLTNVFDKTKSPKQSDTTLE